MMTLQDAANKYNLPVLHVYKLGRSGEAKLHETKDKALIDEGGVEKYIARRAASDEVLRDQITTIIGYILGEGITQTALSEYMDVKFSWIQRIMFQTPGYEILAKTSHAFGLSTRNVLDYSKSQLKYIAGRAVKEIEQAKKHLQ